ncbi:MAG: choice-of-anchor J domain-containing protein, partial [Bacteroidales bacterium]|nr:choice-of-anchor J domain-containing protein [Bacteroidales bacterium]
MKKVLLLSFLNLLFLFSITGKAQPVTAPDQMSGNRSNIVFFEDFLNEELPAGWQNNYSSGMPFDFTAAANFSLAYIFSEQGFPDVKAQLQSPAIDLSAYAKVTMAIEHLFYIEGEHPADELASIEYSFDEQNWLPIVSFSESNDEPGSWPESTYDITDFVAGEPQVYLRFNFDVPEYLDDYYFVLWEIESITLTASTADFVDELPWSEGFAAGDVPNGWEQQILGDSGWDFHLDPFPHISIYAFPGMPHANARLITPVFDLTTETQVILGMHYQMYIYDPEEVSVTQIQYSEDGTNWIPIELPNLDTEGEFIISQFDLTQTLAGKQFQLALFVDYPSGIDNYEVVWEMREIFLEGAGAPTYTVTFHVQDESGDPIDDATISLGDMVNEPGNYVFDDLLSGFYTYQINREGYYPATGELTLSDQNIEINVSLELITYTVQFEVFDYNFFVIDDAVVTVNGTAYAPGDYYHTLVPGSYDYSVAKEGWQDATGVFELTDQNLTVKAYLEPLSSSVLSLPVFEDFSGLDSNELPIGWHRTSAVWQINSTNHAGGEAPEISYEFENYTDAEGEDKILTPWIDPLSETQLWLTIDHYLDDQLGEYIPYTIRIEGTHDLENWELFWIETPEEDIGPENLVLDISAMAGAPFKIAFVVDLGTSSSPIALNWFLDNILVEAESAPEIYTITFEVDMRTASNFDPDIDQVFLNGSMFEWAEPGSQSELQLMSRVDDSWKWTKTLELEEGDYEYKYFLNAGWEGAEWEGEPNRDILADADKTQSDFWSFIDTPPLITLSLLSDPADAGTLEGAGEYYQNQTVTISALPAEQFNFLYWTHQGNIITNEPSFDYLIPSENTTLTAHFEAIPEPVYTLTLTANPVEGGTVNGSGDYHANDPVTVQAVPTQGWSFVNWTAEDNTVLSTELQYSFLMPAEDLSLTANFETEYIASVPFSEDFEENFPPLGWKIYDIDGGSTTRIWEANTTYNHTTNGTTSAYHMYGPTGNAEDGWMVTPKIQLTAQTDIELRFWSYNQYPGDYGKNSVLISLGNGHPLSGEFIELWSPVTVVSEWEEAIIDLTGYVGQDVYIAFRYEGTYAHSWYVDDITITEAAQPASISISPSSLSEILEPGQTSVQQLTVTNTGGSDLSFEIEVNIQDGANVLSPVSDPVNSDHQPSIHADAFA